jgi:hypothetical protein
MRLDVSVNMKSLMVAALVCIGAGLLGCESKDDAKLAKAQQCLDKATPSTVDTCTSMIAGDTSEKAYLIRCAGHYIKNGFVGSRIAEAFNNIKQQPGGGATTDPMTTAMSIMAFTTMDSANQALSDCVASRVRSMERLATMTSMATLIATSAQGIIGAISEGGLTQAQMEQAIQNFTGDPAQLGTLVIQAESAYCNEGSSFENNEVCRNLSAAVASGDTSAIGTSLLAQLQQLSNQ